MVREVKKEKTKKEKEEAKAEAKKEKEAKKAEAEAVKQASREHGVEKIENTSRSFWAKQTITILKHQAELRGHRFTDVETKGGNKIIKGASTKVKGFRKADYLDILLKLMKI